MSDLDDFSVPMPSGLRRLTPEENEAHRRQHREMVKRLLPKLIEMDRARNLAAAEARNAVIG